MSQEDLQNTTISAPLQTIPFQPLVPLYFICIDCGEEFTFPVSAQEYFVELGYRFTPKRCRECHHLNKRSGLPQP
ncbi:MAG: zinc-ribbon domain containing protein [Patescibacteria group bacterium]